MFLRLAVADLDEETLELLLQFLRTNRDFGRAAVNDKSLATKLRNMIAFLFAIANMSGKYVVQSLVISVSSQKTQVLSRAKDFSTDRISGFHNFGVKCSEGQTNSDVHALNFACIFRNDRRHEGDFRWAE